MRYLFFFAVLIVAFNLYAQDLITLWSGYMSTATQAPTMTAFETDAAGNVYYVGKTPMNTSYNYDPFGGVLIMSPVGSFDCFIVKVSSAGSVLWGTTIGGSGEDVAEDLVIDDSGYVYVTGTFENVVDFDPGPGVANFTAPVSNENPFILKLDTAGNYIWNKTLEGPWSGNNHRITVDRDHNVLITGHFSVATVDFNPGAAVFNLPFTSGVDLFVLKLDYTGNFVWAKAVGGTIHQIPRDIETDTLNNIFIGGDYMETVDFDPGAGIAIHSSLGGRDLFLLKLDAAGDFQWVHTMGGPDDDYGSAVQADPAGHVYFTGDFKGSVDFGIPGIPLVLVSDSPFSEDMFLQRLDGNGVPVWLKQIGGSGVERPAEIKIDGSGNLIIGGSFQGALIDFDPGPGVAESTVFNPGDDAFILKLDSLGNYIFHATTFAAEDEFCSGIALGPGQTIYLAGNFDGYVDLSLGAGTAVYGTGSTVVRPYVAKYHQCTLSESTDTVVSCDSYVWPLTGLTYTSTNIYSSVETDLYGCDSIVYLDLTINQVDAAVFQNNFTLTSAEAGAAYQWIDCTTQLPVISETEQSFTVTHDGLFSVVVDNGFCTDTSSCFLIEGLGIGEQERNQLRIYPNPASQEIRIDFNAPGKFKILDMTGKLILSGTTNSTQKIDVACLQAGTYILSVTNVEESFTLQSLLVKE